METRVLLSDSPCPPNGGERGRGIGVLLLAALFLPGCPARQSQTEPNTLPVSGGDRSAGAFAQTDPWKLTTTDPKAARGNDGLFLSNGTVGVTAKGEAGLDATATLRVAGLYTKNETLASAQAGKVFDIPRDGGSGDKPYSQTLDMKRGVLVTESGGNTITSFVSATAPGLVVTHVDGRTLSSAASRAEALAAGDGAFIGVSQRSLTEGSTYTNLVTVAPGREREMTDKAATRTLLTVPPGPVQVYDDLRKAHEAVWAKRWADGDIIIDGDPEAQQMVHKALFDLMQSLPPGGGADSIAPETLSGDFYKGHIFWDADVWMFPALLAQHPDLARGILEYRFRHLEQARAQAKAHGFAGADFPWESAASGKEVAPGGFSEGRHVTAGVGWAAWQYYLATGDKAWLQSRGWPLLFNIADFWVSRAKKNLQTGKWDVLRVFGPDELKGRVDNNTYTNALARSCLLAAAKAAPLVGKKANPQWAIVAENIALPFDKAKGVYLTRQNDDGTKTKQADGELILYPAALPMDDKTAQATFDFHKTRPIKNGPAMTTSIHALLAARLGRAAEAEQFFRDSYRPFVRGPFLLFSEKRSLDRCVFTTGEGGLLQSVIYGFGGLDYSSPTGLIKGKPALPASWKKLTITGIWRGGKRYTLVVTPERRMLTPESAAAPSK